MQRNVWIGIIDEHGEPQTAKAWVDKHFAVHRALGANPKQRKLWAVTHRPTGRLIVYAYKHKKAREVVRYLHQLGINWVFTGEPADRERIRLYVDELVKAKLCFWPDK